MQHAPAPHAPFVTLSGPAEVLDGRYRDLRLSPPAGRCLHASRVLIMAAQALFPPAGTPDARTGVCLSVSNVAGESYAAFQHGLMTGKITPRHYAVSVPNAATSELCLKVRLAGPSVTLTDTAQGPVDNCPQLLLARDWLGAGVVDRALVGAVHVAAAPGDETRCVLVLADRDTADRLLAARSAVPAAPDAVAFLCALAGSAGLSEAKGT